MLSRALVVSSFAALASCYMLTNPLIKKTPSIQSVSRINAMHEPSSTKALATESFTQISQILGKVASVGLLYSIGSTANAAEETTEAPVGETFITTSSGLKYFDVKVGQGASPQPGDTVRVHYTGWLDDFESEKKFDSSYDRRSPLVFKVGVRQVIAGWDEALLTDLKVGGIRKVIIPSELGYGKRGAGGVIPPNATLYFKMELVGIGAR